MYSMLRILAILLKLSTYLAHKYVTLSILLLKIWKLFT